MAATFVAVALTACSDTAEPRPQWTVAIVTDAPVPQFGDRLLVEVLPEEGAAACAECRRQVPIGPLTTWPVELGVAPRPSGGRARIRVRLHRSEHATAEGLPRGDAAIDAVGVLPTPTGVTRVVLTLPMDCFGVPSDPTARLTCDRAVRAAGPEPVLPVADSALLGVRPGDWTPGASRPCPADAPSEMVCIPGGAFLLGDDRTLALSSRAGAAPEHLVVSSPFAIDREEVTVGVVRNLVRNNLIDEVGLVTRTTLAGCTYLGKEDSANDALPLSCMKHAFATRACAAMKKRLPTEAEWEWAAGGRARELAYPWGDFDEPCDRAIVGRGRGVKEGLTIFDSSTACRLRADQPLLPWGPVAGGAPGDITTDGVRNMGGNVSEWVADVFGSYAEPCWKSGSPLRDPTCMTSSTPDSHTIRGAGWADVPQRAATTTRSSGEVDAIDVGTGFRCARSF